MTALAFDPYRAEQRLRWHNRLTQWRAEMGQTALHGVALAALFALLLVPLLQVVGSAAPIANATLANWPWTLALVASLVMALRHAQRLVALRARQAREWLAAQPVARRMQTRRQRDQILRDALWHVAVGLVVLLLIDAHVAALAGVLVCVCLAAAVAIPLSHRLAPRARASGYLGSRIPDAGIGRFWRWQRIEIGIALRGRSLSFGIWALLLVPMGSGAFTVMAIAMAGLTLAALTTAWHRCLGVLPQAQAWLAAQPLSGARLLRATVAVPLVVLTTSVALIGLVLIALGTPALAAFAALGLIAVGSLQFACAAATRAHPRRMSMLFLVHVTLLIGVLQALPPLAVLCWALQLGFLLRQAARP